MNKTFSKASDQEGYTIAPKKRLFEVELKSIVKYRELLYFLIWRELKVKYKQAVIGLGWTIVQPVCTVAIFAVIFGQFARIPSDGIPYPLFALSSLVPWMFFSGALNRGATSLVGDAQLIQKIYFPRLIIPVAITTPPIVDLAISLLLLIGMMIWYGVTPTWGVLFLPAYILLAWILALALSLWLGPLDVRFRDIRLALPFIIQIWMYASPIVYPVSMIPERWRPLYSLNPIVGVVEGFRWALFGTGSPNFFMMGVSGFFILLLLLGGVVFFNQMERSFADVI